MFSFCSSRFLYAGAVVLAVASANCGGANALNGLPGQNGNNGNNSSGNNGNNGNSGSTDQLIGQLLGDMDHGGGGNTAPTASPEASSVQRAPATTTGGGNSGSSSSSSGGGGNLDTFVQDVQRIRGAVPGWDNGTGVALKFLKESTGVRLSLIYVDPTPPVLKDGVGLWMIQAKATADGKTIGTFVLLLKSLEPGRYEGNPTSRDVIMAAQMGETWDGKDPETTWSINDGSWCEVTLRAGSGPGDLEGDFRAKLVDNKGAGYHTIEAGYIYINR